MKTTLLLVLLCFGLVGSLDLDDGIEDITMNNSVTRNSSPPEFSNTPATSARHINMTPTPTSMYFNGRKHNEQMQDLRFKPKPERSSSFVPHSYGGIPKQKKSTFPPVERDEGDTKQTIAGIPDTSDPCFRRYENCIVVNAQPYERRSSTSLLKCKVHCLHSQTGVYSCRSFVYDNVNEVCDLFAHVGDQSPARLLKFQTRDYFEPTSAVQCLDVNEEPEVVARASNIDERKEEFNKVKVEEQLVEQKTTHDEEIETPCPSGKTTGFLRTEGFELFNNDDVILDVSDVFECTTACKKNTILGKRLECKSFDYSSGRCAFSKEAAVPVGEGQLKQKKDSFYYEKICVMEKMQCSAAFNRSPQMILVGYAESVSNSATFEHCFDSCLNSFQMFGFNCTSGMYYFEESQLNCILNSQNRYTQPDLFAEENTDIVDYFEVACEQKTKNIEEKPRASGVKTVPDSTPIQSEKLVIAAETQTEWSPCMDGLQHRRRDCREREDCGMESRQCGKRRNPEKEKTEKKGMPTKEEITALKAKLAKEGFRCPQDHCCKVFETCQVGLRQNSKSRQLEWCKTPCIAERRREKHRTRHRRESRYSTQL